MVKEILSPNVNKKSKYIYKLKEVNQNEENLFTQPRFSRKSEKRNKVKLTKEVIYNFNNRYRKCATSGNIQVNGEYVDCLLDTGAFTSFISEEYFRKRNLIKQSIDNIAQVNNLLAAQVENINGMLQESNSYNSEYDQEIIESLNSFKSQDFVNKLIFYRLLQMKQIQFKF